MSRPTDPLLDSETARNVALLFVIVGTIYGIAILHLNWGLATCGACVVVYAFVWITKKILPTNAFHSRVADATVVKPESPNLMEIQELTLPPRRSGGASLVASLFKLLGYFVVASLCCTLLIVFFAFIYAELAGGLHLAETRNVTYSDLLTSTNDHVFQEHHSWSDTGNEKGNTDAAEMAMARLGPAAYGKSFRELIDFEKEKERYSVPLGVRNNVGGTVLPMAPRISITPTNSTLSNSSDLLDPDVLTSHLNSRLSPSWMHLVQGQTAILQPDAELNGNHDYAYICNSLIAVKSGLDQGSPDAEDCVQRPAGKEVLFESLHAVSGTDPKDRHLEAFVKSLDGAWSGYADFDQLTPIVPVGAKLRTKTNDAMVEPFKHPHLDNVETYQISPHSDFGQARGTEIGEADVEMLRWVPFHPYDANATAYQALVKVTSGKDRGLIGWIDGDFLVTNGGFNVSCFCPPSRL